MSGFPLLIIYILVFVGIFYFLAVRPQRRQRAQHAEMIGAMKKGDEVLTVGGIYGTIRKMGDDWVELEIAPRTRVRFVKRAISSITQVPDEEEDEYVDEEYEEEAAGELEAGEEEYAEEEYAEEEYAEEEPVETAEGEEAYEEEIAEAPKAPEAEKPGSRRRKK